MWKEDICSLVSCPSLWIICTYTWWFLIMEKLCEIFQWCQVGVLLTVWSFKSKISLKTFDLSMQARVWVFAGMVCYFVRSQEVPENLRIISFGHCLIPSTQKTSPLHVCLSWTPIAATSWSHAPLPASFHCQPCSRSIGVLVWHLPFVSSLLCGS